MWGGGGAEGEGGVGEEAERTQGDCQRVVCIASTLLPTHGKNDRRGW